MADGYIKLYRNLLENKIFSNEKLLKVWIWCLLKASHQPREVTIGLQKLRLEAGQFYTGRHNAGEELGLKPSTAWRYILGLKSLEKVDIKSNNKFSVVTVVNWDFYQSEKGAREQQNGHQMDIKWTSNGHQMDTNKNVKNVKNNIYTPVKNNIYTPVFEEFWKVYPRKIEKKSAFAKWKAKLNQGYTPEQLIAAAKNYAIKKQGTEEQYIKHPATFLGPSTSLDEWINPQATKSPEEQQRAAAQEKQYRERVTAALQYIKLTHGDNPDREKAKKTADKYGEDVSKEVMQRLFGGG